MRESSAESAVGRLLESYLRDLESGHPPDRQTLLAQNPELADVLGPALDGLDFVHGATRTLKGAPGDAGVGTGEVLGDFRLLREIGRGGMAIVFEAEQVSLGRRVALKVLPFASVLDPKQRQRFKNEALAAAQLRHPHIVPVYAVGSERGVHYYAMQYVEGESLAAAIRGMKEGGEPERRTPPFAAHRSHRDAGYARMVASLAIQAAGALEHAHQLGIVHRDVKPANLLVDQAGTLWVTDFGLARSLKDAGLTISGELLGTVRYMSPEQALASRVPVDHRTDVYSLGATLYELLALEPAFQGEDLHRILDDIASKEPAPPRRLNPAVPVDLETIVLKAMAKDPAVRYASAQELADDLQRWLDDEPVLARRPSLLKRVGKWARRHRKGVAASVTIVFVGALALAAGAMKEERKTRHALDKAEANLDLAHQAVNEFLTQWGTSQYEDQPTCTPELRKIFERALAFYEHYLAQRADPYGYVDMSYILVALGRHQEGLAAAREAIRLGGDLALPHHAEGNVLRMLGKHAEAMAAYNRAIALDANRAGTYLQRGVVHRDLGNLEAAIVDWNHALELDPKLPKALNNRGVAFETRGEHQRALESFKEATSIAPNFAHAHMNVSLAQAQLGNLDEARASAERAIALLPDWADAHLELSTVLKMLGDRDRARREIEKALELDPKLGRAHYNQSVFLIEEGNIDAALAELAESIRLEPNYLPARTNFGGLLFAKGEHAKALTAYEDALAIDKNDVQAHCGRGQTLGALERLDEALAAYEAAIGVDKKCFNAIGNKAGILNRLERYEEALKAANEALKLDDQVALPHVFRGIALYWLGRHQDALDSIDRAIALDDRNGDFWEKRGTCLEALGRSEEAAQAHDHAAELNRIQAEAVAPPEGAESRASRPVSR